MAKVEAPEIEPLAEKAPTRPGVRPVASPSRPKNRPRGKYIDFAPRKKKLAAPKLEPVAEEEIVENAPEKVTVIVAPTPAPEELPEEVVEETTITHEETTAIVAGDPLAEFNDLDDGAETEEDLERALDNFASAGPEAETDIVDEEEEAMEEAQEDFLAEEDPDAYVDAVLAQVSESRTTVTTKKTTRSPFLKDYNIEKRPLSNLVPEKPQLPSQDYLEPTELSDFEPEDFATKADRPPVTEEPVVPAEETAGSKFGMFITVLITILLGAGVGVFVYLVFFQ